MPPQTTRPPNGGHVVCGVVIAEGSAAGASLAALAWWRRCGGDRVAGRLREQAFGLVLDDQRIEHALGDLALVRREVAQGLELEFERFVRAAFVLVEEQHICADAQRHGEPPQDIEGGLAGAALVALQLREVDADEFGELTLGERARFAQLCEAFGEVHVQQGGQWWGARGQV